MFASSSSQKPGGRCDPIRDAVLRGTSAMALSTSRLNWGMFTLLDPSLPRLPEGEES